MSLLHRASSTVSRSSPHWTVCILHTRPAISTPTFVQLQAVRPFLELSPSCSKAYHSYGYSQSTTFSPTESSILSAALTHVPVHGFTDTALYCGASDAGFPEVSVNVFPRGAFDLISYHLITQRLSLRHLVQYQEGSKVVVGAKVRRLVLQRLQANKHMIRHWQQVGLNFSLPVHHMEREYTHKRTAVGAFTGAHSLVLHDRV